jgi:5'-3' exonuclease
MTKTFYIIDGHAHIYRAYFAPFRDLNSPIGEPTKATFVFTQMLLNLVALRKPDYEVLEVADAAGEQDHFAGLGVAVGGGSSGLASVR